MKTTNNPNTANKFNIHLLDKYMLNDENMDRISRSGYVDMSFLRKQAASSVRKTKPPVRVPAPANASIPSQAVEESPIMFTPRTRHPLLVVLHIEERHGRIPTPSTQKHCCREKYENRIH